ncbi:bifunctional alpha/beta hydrolase/OsmC family protein [Psychroflexus salis]|uniref:Osmotically inducible protein C n=1 Tax=Psychroflexus salis TaxID=1526574 RepID=A0A916ZNQ6_9FLAO|nr:bifunctional alpha/beta hydrolase/OsmC family protein [Psychroflexus salis]GGE06692.1 osmotically inducible protein C [Psychroflexus salis]
MYKKNISFNNQKKEELKAILYLPTTRKAHSFAIFAHCFTCNKNFKNIKNISQSLTDKGFGVFSFDFTGLGESEGEFADTNFSHNIQDILAAVNFLKENYTAPNLLIGHSLGGTACIYASLQVPSCKAVVSIGSPHDPEHVKQLLEENLDDINENGEAKVNIGGRSFKIKKSFVEDIEKQSKKNALDHLKASLLILHSPQDKIVGIKNAEKLYKAARHPKSFVSLEGANHLLTNESDSKYVGQVIASWSKRYLDTEEDSKKLESEHQVVAHLNKNDNFLTDIKARHHYLKADEPEDYGGTNLGPNPYEFVSAGLAACTAMTIQMYAKHKDWPLSNVEVHINYEKVHAEDAESNSSKKIDTFSREIVLNGNINEEQKEKLLQIANKCPVHKTLSSQIQIKTKLQ